MFCLSATGCSQASVGASQSEDADGSDLVPVHLRVQGPHPVPPQLPADLTTGISTDDCSGFCSTVVPNCSAVMQMFESVLKGGCLHSVLAVY